MKIPRIKFSSEAERKAHKAAKDKARQNTPEFRAKQNQHRRESVEYKENKNAKRREALRIEAASEEREVHKRHLTSEERVLAKERNRLKWHEWKEKNLESHLIKNADGRKEYYKKNKDKCAALSRKYRAIKRGSSGTHTADDIKALFFEQSGLCGLCDLPLDAEKYHVDHWKPLAKGGSNDKSNLKLLHPRCNLSKGAKLPEEYNVA